MGSFLSVKVDMSKALQVKLNKNTYDTMIREVIKRMTLFCEGECKKEAPYKTGNLRRSHSTKIDGKRGYVKNSAKYWRYVVFGTAGYTVKPVNAKVLHFMTESGDSVFTKEAHIPPRPPNPYPSRVVRKMASMKYAQKTSIQVLREMGAIS